MAAMLSRVDPRITRAALFLGLFLAATAGHYALRPHIAPVLNRDLNALNAARLINLLTPEANVRAVGETVGSGAAHVRIAMGCEGLDMLLMVTAALLATPMGSVRKKLLGVVIGVSLLFALNLVRIASLWYCIRYYPSFFDTLHQSVGQTVMIVAGVTFFGLWTGTFRKLREDLLPGTASAKS